MAGCGAAPRRGPGQSPASPLVKNLSSTEFAGIFWKIVLCCRKSEGGRGKMKMSDKLSGLLGRIPGRCAGLPEALRKAILRRNAAGEGGGAEDEGRERNGDGRGEKTPPPSQLSGIRRTLEEPAAGQGRRNADAAAALARAAIRGGRSAAAGLCGQLADRAGRQHPEAWASASGHRAGVAGEKGTVCRRGGRKTAARYGDPRQTEGPLHPRGGDPGGGGGDGAGGESAQAEAGSL